jgi:hypothetical protein
MFVPKSFLIAPLALVMLIDLALTLGCQPHGYWQNYTCCIESSPIGHVLLSVGPGYFAASFIAYALAIIFAGVKLPKPFNLVVFVAAFLGHAWGGSSWIPTLYSCFSTAQINPWYLSVGYFCSIAAVAGIYCNRRT